MFGQNFGKGERVKFYLISCLNKLKWMKKGEEYIHIRNFKNIEQKEKFWNKFPKVFML